MTTNQFTYFFDNADTDPCQKVRHLYNYLNTIEHQNYAFPDP